MKRAGSVFQFMARETLRSVVCFYIVIAAIFFVLLPLLRFSGNVNTTGVDGASMIFLFVIGLNFFKHNFLFSQANGVSRRHFYLGSLMALAAVAATLTVVGCVLDVFVRLFDPGIKDISALIYPKSSFLSGFVWTLFTNLAFMVLGWFIAMVFYRSGKALKLVISIGIPVFLFIVLPMLNEAMHGVIFDALGKSITFLMGLTFGPSIWVGVLSMFVVAAAFSGFCYLLVRRAPVKSI